MVIHKEMPRSPGSTKWLAARMAVWNLHGLGDIRLRTIRFEKVRDARSSKSGPLAYALFPNPLLPISYSTPATSFTPRPFTL